MRALNLDQLRTLVSVLELGSFSAAARALHLAQPTISLHVAELESKLGTPLLLRGGPRVQPTPAGELLAERAHRLLRDADEAIELVQRQRDGRAGRVRLGSSTGAMVHLLPQLLEALDAALPEIDVQVTIGRSSELMAKLFVGDVDLALVALPQPRYPQIRVTPWRSTPMMAMLPARWPAPKLITPQWLADKPLILNEPDTHVRRQVMDWFAGAGVLPRARIEMSFNEVTRRLIAAGYGAAILPFEHPSEALDGRIQVLRLKPAMPRRLGVACRSAKTLAAPIRSVLDAVMAFRE
ncbi:LysR family transcriptional regulator [Aquincola sp. S2]|uniref:LysR family transcriptional regulator n=1 Tax=Pseudaquabacterium terrae TaxID=2732868 RepID=A0ABX2EPY3_9BURK|nr:LysR family transcriptional regulator [Aquabacterium terrae]NRF70701.1 LysR family transcriptional regulator [Aquabacterium terrae]